jgi:transcriptional regulator with XRE-family HTH domain
MTKLQIAKILKESRGKAGLTQQQAADAIKRKRQTLASWETGKSQPDANTLFELFDVYGLSVSEAFGYKKKSPASEVEAGDKNIFSDELMKNYRALNHEGRRKLVDYSKDLVSGGRYAAIKEDAG